jgi:hypothetical protein
VRERLDFDRADVVAALHDSRDAAGVEDVGRAAKLLGAARRTLQSRMREYGIPKGRAGRRRRKLSYRRGRRNMLIAIGALAGAAGVIALRRRSPA